MKKRYDNLIMGENISYSMDTNLTGCNNNRIIIGGTGEGKSLSHTVPFILHMNNTSGIFTFSKRQDVDKLIP